MEVKVKKQNNDGLIRLESVGRIKEIRINEDFLNPENESISVCFKGKESSGILSFTPAEIEELYNAVRDKTHLIKGIKKFKTPPEDSI
ncbi:MAG: hypothetical protein ACOCQG_00465 [Candidatus Nanoarchaeia archaeon]